MAQQAANVLMQGIEVPAAAVNPDLFFQHTRRLGYPMQTPADITGLGSGDTCSLKKAGIISGLEVRIFGSITFGGTITGTTMTYAWPYNLIKALRVSANGQANLINASGLQLKALSVMKPDSQDRGISRPVGSATPNQGTLSLASEDWGTASTNTLGPGKAAPAAATYSVDFTIHVPIAFDDKTLTGAVFAQTSSTNLVLDIDWATQSDIVTLGGSATFAHALKWQVQGIVHSIPSVSGKMVIPDLSTFHQVVGWDKRDLGAGENEITLPGVGPGRQLMRLYGQVYDNTIKNAPLAVNSTNFPTMAWRYGGNDTPEVYTGSQLRAHNERLYNSDIGSVWGFFCHDWANEWAYRDSVDAGSAPDLRLVVGLAADPTAGVARCVAETVFGAPAGA